MSTALTTTEPKRRRRPKVKPPFTRSFKPTFDLICAGATYKMAAAQGGYSERHIYRVMRNPAVKALMRSMAVDTVDNALPRAAQRLVSLMDQDDSKKVSLDATTHVLGIHGLRPAPTPAAQVNIANLPTMFRVYLGPNPVTTEAEYTEYLEEVRREGPIPDLRFRGTPELEKQRLQIEAEWRERIQRCHGDAYPPHFRANNSTF